MDAMELCSLNRCNEIFHHLLIEHVSTTTRIRLYNHRPLHFAAATTTTATSSGPTTSAREASDDGPMALSSVMSLKATITTELQF
ncbi:hypothetical protein HKD37_17G047289 [Glycine soja]